MGGPTRRVRRSGRLVSVLVAGLSLTLLAACTGAGAQWHKPDDGAGSSSSGPTTTSSAPDSQFTITPAANAKNVSPADPVTVQLTAGTLDAVTVTNPDGKQVRGDFAPDKSSWKSAEELGYDKRYTITASGNGANGRHFQETRTFTTVKPMNYTLPYLRANVGTLLDGGTFGVGQPIVLWFDEPIKDKKAAEQALTVTTDPAVEGAWRWMDDHEVHWRPKEYWPAGTKVRVDAKVYGRNLGNGLYGQEDRSASFTIGHSKIAIADSNTHRMKVFIDGVQVTKINGRDVTAGIPISMGKGGTEVGANGQVVDFWTRTGPHVVTMKYEEYRMTSASFGITNKNSANYYDVKIKKSIRISGAGEFVHLADWNVWAHGKVNTSHGCINVGPAYIYWFYDQFGAGDIVEVKHTPKPLDVRDGLGDWVVSWDEWVKGSALA
jgi:lipoprotein-anchoring transpeptidase ErfK/SrfK